MGVILKELCFMLYVSVQYFRWNTFSQTRIFHFMLVCMIKVTRVSPSFFLIRLRRTVLSKSVSAMQGCFFVFSSNSSCVRSQENEKERMRPFFLFRIAHAPRVVNEGDLTNDPLYLICSTKTFTLPIKRKKIHIPLHMF